MTELGSLKLHSPSQICYRETQYQLWHAKSLYIYIYIMCTCTHGEREREREKYIHRATHRGKVNSNPPSRERHQAFCFSRIQVRECRNKLLDFFVQGRASLSCHCPLAALAWCLGEFLVSWGADRRGLHQEWWCDVLELAYLEVRCHRTACLVHYSTSSRPTRHCSLKSPIVFPVKTRNVSPKCNKCRCHVLLVFARRAPKVVICDRIGFHARTSGIVMRKPMGCLPKVGVLHLTPDPGRRLFFLSTNYECFGLLFCTIQ